jgi:Late exocytosis, associated with Golgi transport
VLCNRNLNYTTESRRITKPSRSPAESPKKGLFGWIRSVTKVSDAETLRCVGLDTYMFLRQALLFLFHFKSLYTLLSVQQLLLSSAVS